MPSSRTLASVLLLWVWLAGCSSGSRGMRETGEPPRAANATFEAHAAGVLVLFDDGTIPAHHLELADAAGADVVYRYRSIPALYVRDRAGDQTALVARLVALPGVIAATLDRPVRATRIEAPPPVVRAGQARLGNHIRTQPIGMAVVDSGVNSGAGVPLGSRCFSAFRGGGCEDTSGQGTLLTLLATSDEDPLVIYPVQVVGPDLAGSDATLVAGLDWIAAHASVVEPTIRVAVTVTGRPGSADDSPVLHAVVLALERAGVLLVVGGATGQIPSIYPEVISVAGADAVTAGSTARAAARTIRGTWPTDPRALRYQVLTTALAGLDLSFFP